MSILEKKAKIKPDEKRLLQLTFANTIAQEDVEDLLRGYDIESASIEFSLLLSYLLKRHPHIKFPKDIMPRLEGIMKFTHYKNATLLCAFSELGKQLNEKKIPILLMKGVAMRYFRPHEARLMWDVDFLVLEEDYAEAVQTAIEMGYERKDISEQYHSTDLFKGAACMDIHRLFTKGVGNYWTVIREMFANAEHADAFGVEVFVPRLEDLLLITMTNSYYNIVIQPPEQMKSFFWFYDCARIIGENKDLNWQVLLDTADKIGILYQIQTMLELLAWLIPSAIPSDLLPRMAAKELNHKVKLDILDREKLKLFVQREALSSEKCKTVSDVAEKLKVEITYICLRLLRRVPLVRFLFLDAFIKFYEE